MKNLFEIWENSEEVKLFWMELLLFLILIIYIPNFVNSFGTESKTFIRMFLSKIKFLKLLWKKSIAQWPIELTN